LAALGNALVAAVAAALVRALYISLMDRQSSRRRAACASSSLGRAGNGQPVKLMRSCGTRSHTSRARRERRSTWLAKVGGKP
jgi:hypothetical protein